MQNHRKSLQNLENPWNPGVFAEITPYGGGDVGFPGWPFWQLIWEPRKQFSVLKHETTNWLTCKPTAHQPVDSPASSRGVELHRRAHPLQPRSNLRGADLHRLALHTDHIGGDSVSPVAADCGEAQRGQSDELARLPDQRPGASHQPGDSPPERPSFGFRELAALPTTSTLPHRPRALGHFTRGRQMKKTACSSQLQGPSRKGWAPRRRTVTGRNG
eukprot:gene6001-biopygen7272